MKQLILSESVTHTGLNIIERPARITFSPFPELGWWWKTPSGSIGPIKLETTSPVVRCNCLTLRRRLDLLAIYEHIGALKWTGLTGVLVESTPLPPYDGRVIEQWEALQFKTEATEDPIHWVTGRHDGETMIYHQKVPDGFIQYLPSYFPELKVTIHIDYPGLGEYKLVWQSHQEPLTSAFNAFTQGYSKWHQQVANFIGWAHLDKVNWNDGTWSNQITLQRYALHRLADLLGALSLVTNDKLLAGEIISYGAGHAEDLRLIKQIVQGGLNVLPQ